MAKASGFRFVFAAFARGFGPDFNRRLPGWCTVKRLPLLFLRRMVNLQQQWRRCVQKGNVSQSICDFSLNRRKRIRIHIYNVSQPDSDRRKSRRMENVLIPIVACNSDWALIPDLENWQQALRLQKCKRVAIYCGTPPDSPTSQVANRRP